MLHLTRIHLHNGVKMRALFKFVFLGHAVLKKTNYHKRDKEPQIRHYSNKYSQTLFFITKCLIIRILEFCTGNQPYARIL